jgi:hypothetical protein
MRCLLVILFGVLAGPALRAADDFTAEKAKALIPDASGVSSAELQKIAAAGSDPTKYRPSNGDSLTWLVLNYAPGPGAPKNPTSFRFLEDTANPANVAGPARLAGAIMGPKDKDGKFRKFGTVIQPEYITDCTCKVDGDTATGTVTFKAEKVYEGKADYTARKKDGKWRIEEFRLPDLKITVALGADGKWAKK